MKIIGLKKNEGTFNDRPYVNYDIYYQVPNRDNMIGIIVEKVKFRNDNLVAFLKKNNVASVDKLVGIQFEEILYNAYKQAVDLR